MYSECASVAAAAAAGLGCEFEAISVVGFEAAAGVSAVLFEVVRVRVIAGLVRERFEFVVVHVVMVS